MHARYFRVFWVSSTQIGCSMRVVYSDEFGADHCNYFYSHFEARVELRHAKEKGRFAGENKLS